jgi:group II intron reverse transcriptase/maturase
MHEHGKSDEPVVPTKPGNEIAQATEDSVEGRGSAKRNSGEQTMPRTQRRHGMPHALARVRQAAREKRKQQFTALLHHVYDADRLRNAYLAMKRDASSGVDGVTWQHYGEELEVNLQELSGRLKRGAYRAKPVRRAYIPKADGGQRPLGVPALEDKIVQRAVVEVLNAIYETDFLGFSYGFRPKRSAHDALDALAVGLMKRKVSWVLDADIRGFFDTLDHGWLVKFLEHRIADRRVVRLIQKWLNAGVLESGTTTRSEVGTVQGGSISPLLANVYLHYVLDLWLQRWRAKEAKGDVIVVRYADDFVIGFERREEAEQMQRMLRERFAQFGLQLHESKTRLIEFGRFATEARRKRGERRPETFDFLGFTHICEKTRQGYFSVVRHTARERLIAKLGSLRIELRNRMHQTLDEQGAYLRSVVVGHVRYFGVPFNGEAIAHFRQSAVWLWWRTLRRRGNRQVLPWRRMERYAARWIPAARVCQPHSLVRFGDRLKVGAGCGKAARPDLRRGL